MKFFDSKEEVLDVQITKYGRNMLSKGLWKPVYYSFFDDNVLYDSEYGGYTENKNSAETRIQDDTPLLTTQHNFTGRDEYLFDGVGDILERKRIGIYESLNVMPYSLGTTEFESTKTPAIRAQFLQGEIDALENNLTGNVRTTNIGSTSGTHYSQQLLKIPQLEMEVEYKITVAETGPSAQKFNFEIDRALTPGNIYIDGAEVLVGPEQILFVVEEKNASFGFHNFDIEVYEITDEVGVFGEQILNPLDFVKPVEMVRNNILLDRKEAEELAGRLNGIGPEITPDFVRYYFDINVDDEIDENIICKSISKLRKRGKSLFTDLDINCPDLGTPISAAIYASDALDEDCADY